MAQLLWNLFLSSFFQVLWVQRIAVPLVLWKRWTALLQEGLLGQIRGAVPRLQRPNHHRPHHGNSIHPLTLISHHIPRSLLTDKLTAWSCDTHSTHIHAGWQTPSPNIYSLPGWCLPPYKHTCRIGVEPVTDPDAFGCFVRLFYRPPVKVGSCCGDTGEQRGSCSE